MNSRPTHYKNRFDKGLFILIFVCLSIFTSSCLENPSPPDLITRQIEIIEFETISSGGTITDDGGSEIFQKGICISLHAVPTVEHLYTMDGVGNNDFTTTLNLAPNNLYYIRAYAVNGAGIGYGNILSVRLEPKPYGEAVIVDFGDISGDEAFMRGRVESNQTITSRGACWSKTENPTIYDNKTEAGSGTGIFETKLTGLSPGTKYYTRAYAASDAEVYYSSNFEFTTVGYPELTTKEIINKGTFVVSTGGEITSPGIILNAGVCWSTSPTPTIEDNKTEDQLIYSTFYSDPFGLLPATTYYLRSYATNIAGTGYGNELVFTMPDASLYDLDGNPYTTVVIGTQTWLTENLRTSKYANGDAIPNIQNSEDWANMTSGAWCYFENIVDFEVPYGKLYNWYTVTDSRNLCPSGWHVPTEEEWNTLIAFLGGSEFSGNELKETGTSHWYPNNDFATNSSGFTALPGGARSSFPGISYPAQSLGMFWTATSDDEENAYGYYLFDAYQSIKKQAYKKQTGLSVRCIKD